MAAEIFDKLTQKLEEDTYPFHMPGHKRNESFIPFDARLYDFTEVDGLDALHHPTGIIKHANESMAQFTGAEHSYMLVNGGSSGMLAAIIGSVNEGDKILVAANCHQSVYNALVLSGAVPVYISPQITEEGLAGGISISDMYRAFSDNDIKAMVITSPTYEGFTSDVAVIADIVHKHNAILIVDETHGAHFPLSSEFPKTAIEQHADISVNSWHKTMPALNQAAVLNVKSERVDCGRIERAISMVTTTSPSYPILASMDYSRDLLSKDKAITARYIEALWTLRRELAHCHSLKLVSSSIKGQHEIADIDISKLTIMVRTDVTGIEIAEQLRSKYNIEIEFAGLHHIIAMTSVADTEKALKKFGKAIKDLDKKYTRKFVEKIPMVCSSVEVASVTPREIFYSDTKRVAFNDAVGKVCAENVCAFPPDVPVVASGMIVTKEHIDTILRLIEAGVRIMGADDNTISIVKEA